MRGLTLTEIFLIVLPSARLHLTGVKVGALQGDVHRLTNLIQGDWFITDRLKELIKVKGFQVAPAELEALLLSIPGVQVPDFRPFLQENPLRVRTEAGLLGLFSTNTNLFGRMFERPDISYFLEKLIVDISKMTFPCVRS